MNQNSHGNFLNTHLTTDKYVFTETLSLEPGITLQDLLIFGIKEKGRFSNDVFGIFVKELLKIDPSGRPPYIFAVNSVNAIYSLKSNMRYSDIKGETIDDYDPLRNVEEFTLVQHCRKLLRGNWQNGVILCSTRQSDQIYGYERTGASGDSRNQRKGIALGKPLNAPETTGIHPIFSDHPQDLLHEQGFRDLDPHIPIYEGNFTGDQVDALMRYYENKKYINFIDLPSIVDNLTDVERARVEFRQVVDRNPGQFLKCAAQY